MPKFNKDFVLVGLKAQDSDAVIIALADQLHEAGMVENSYGMATIERESQHPTGLPTKPFPIAFPHADSEGVIDSALAVAILDSPVSFKNMADPDEELLVELVIMLANKDPEEQIETLRSLAELFGEQEKLFELRHLQTKEEIEHWLKKELSL